MEKINILFDDSETPLQTLNRVCLFGTLDRTNLFNQIKTGICANHLSKDDKSTLLDTARDYIKKTLMITPVEYTKEAEEAAKELYVLIDAADQLDCAGP